MKSQGVQLVARGGEVEALFDALRDWQEEMDAIL